MIFYLMQFDGLHNPAASYQYIHTERPADILSNPCIPDRYINRAVELQIPAVVINLKACIII